MTRVVLQAANRAWPPPPLQRRPAGGHRPLARRDDPRRVSAPAEPSTLRLVAGVLLPFAAGYFVSFVFRSINAVIAGPLAAEFDLGPAALGLMTSMYFLVFMLVQVPAGAAIDRYGPRRIQAALMVVAATGAAVFAMAETLFLLMLGRALIGLGVSVALMTGFKAIVLWVPPQRLALANGGYVMLGALGAVAATLPAELLVATLGWRRLFEGLAIASLAIAAVICLAVPERPVEAKPTGPTFSIADIYQDPRFWRIAPLSAALIASSWSLQGLWAAPWLADVDQLTRPAVIDVLFAMAVALSAGALALGIIADRLRTRGVSSTSLLAAVAGLSVVAQLAIALHLPVPAALPWMVVALSGASTVLSFASLAALYPKACSGRANAALNLLHVGGAFFVQAGFGLIVQLWPEQNGQHPAAAYETALGAVIAIQLLGMLWFVVSTFRARTTLFAAHQMHAVSSGGVNGENQPSAYDRAADMWMERVANAREQVVAWRRAAIASATIVLSIAILLITTINQRDAPPRHIIERHARIGSFDVRRQRAWPVTSMSFAGREISSWTSTQEQRA